MQVISDKHLFAAVRQLGFTCSKRDSEYRVNVKNGRKESTYYTNDRQDAYDTAVAIANSTNVLDVLAHKARSDRSAVYAARILLEKHKHELDGVTIGQISDAYHVLGVLASKLEER
jgi:hypothetical protein